VLHASGHGRRRRGGGRHDHGASASAASAADASDVGPVRGQLRVRHDVRLGDAPGVGPAVVVAAERVGGAGRGVLMRVRHHRLLDDLVRGLGRAAVATAAAEQLLESHQNGQRERDLAHQQRLAGQQRQALVRHGQQTSFEHHQVHLTALVLFLLAACAPRKSMDNET